MQSKTQFFIQFAVIPTFHFSLYIQQYKSIHIPRHLKIAMIQSYLFAKKNAIIKFQ